MTLKELKPVFDLMNVQEERIVLKLNEIIDHVKEINGDVSLLKAKELIRSEHEKYRIWKACGLVLAAAIGASLILNFGILEFLKLI